MGKEERSGRKVAMNGDLRSQKGKNVREKKKSWKGKEKVDKETGGKR